MKAIVSPVDRRRAAADRHDEHASLHGEMAAMWEQRGDGELAGLERRAAELERAAAELDRERARLIERRHGVERPTSAQLDGRRG